MIALLDFITGLNRLIIAAYFFPAVAKVFPLYSKCIYIRFFFFCLKCRDTLLYVYFLVMIENLTGNSL